LNKTNKINRITYQTKYRLLCKESNTFSSAQKGSGHSPVKPLGLLAGNGGGAQRNGSSAETRADKLVAVAHNKRSQYAFLCDASQSIPLPTLGYHNKRKTHSEENGVLVGSLDFEGESEAKVSVFVVCVRFVMDGDESQRNARKCVARAFRTFIVASGGGDGVGETI
jgi:hypothetical protein